MNKEEVIYKIGEDNWKTFLDFMNGQTVGVLDNGEPDFYDWDILRFMKSTKYHCIGDELQ